LLILSPLIMPLDIVISLVLAVLAFRVSRARLRHCAVSWKTPPTDPGAA
jgi:hypothetical protein